jgi:RNA polymerase sigma-B factor
MALHVDRATRELTIQSGRAPRIEELVAYLKLPIEEVLTGLEAGTAHFSKSLDSPAPGAEIDESWSLADSLGGDDERLGLIETKLSLSAAISRLPYLERLALSLRIDHDMQQTDIARQLGCSQMQVSRLLGRAFANLRLFEEIAAPHGPGSPPIKPSRSSRQQTNKSVP